MLTRRRDFVRGDCERLVIGDTLHRAGLHVGAALFLRDSDPGAHVARAGGRVVARGRYTLRLNALGRRLLRARGTLRVAVEVRDVDGVNGFRTELQRM